MVQWLCGRISSGIPPLSMPPCASQASVLWIAPESCQLFESQPAKVAVLQQLALAGTQRVETLQRFIQLGNSLEILVGDPFKVVNVQRFGNIV